MADNTTLSAGAGGDVMRDKDRSGVKTPIVGLDLNPAGTETLMAGAMPVTGTFWQATQPVSGTVGATQSGVWSVTVVDSVALAVAAAQSGAWSVIVGAALPAGTNLLGQVSASHETGTLYNGTTALTPKFAPITASALGATPIVAAVASKKIRVLRWSLSANGGVNVKWQSASTDKTGLHYMTQFGTAGGAYCPQGIFETIAGDALNINLSAAVAVGGELTYVEV